MRAVGASVVRATIARLLLGARAGERLGSVTLHAHQREVTGLLRALLSTAGGALLADDVGLGKTFTALAVARGRLTLVIAPSALRPAWLEAAARAGVAIELVTFEALSRGARPAARDLVIVDEAHHLRNPRTIRCASVRAVCRNHPVLLLSATPVQNSEHDLRALLSLFLGETAFALPAAELARYVVRRNATDVQERGPTLPHVEHPHWLAPPDDSDCLDRIIALPPAVPPRDAGEAGPLAAFSLARQWASSRAALEAALRRRLARGLSLADSLRSGRLPSRAELSAWAYADGVQQLGFPELLVPEKAAGEAMELLAQVESHLGGIRALLGSLDDGRNPDEARAARLLAILRENPGRRVVAFSEYTETVTALYTRLVPRCRAAMLTHTGGRVAGGAISRAELIARFAPGVKQRDAERIDLLLTTDVLSEGVGLHDASIVVHLDLAWNPARLAQRVGRLRRIGAASGTVRVFIMPPPGASDRLLRIEQRLRSKLAAAARSVGVAGAILPGTQPAVPSDARREHGIHAAVGTWLGPGDVPATPVMAAARGAESFALICVLDGDSARLLLWQGGSITTERAAIERAVRNAGGCDAAVPPELTSAIAGQVEEWLDHQHMGKVVGVTSIHVARSRRWLMHRANSITRRAPRHARPRIAALARAARSAAIAILSAGAEQVLGELARAELPDEAWLRAVGEFAALHARAPEGRPRIAAMLVVLPA